MTNGFQRKFRETIMIEETQASIDKGSKLVDKIFNRVGSIPNEAEWRSGD